MSQNDIVLKHLKSGKSITQAEAIFLYSIYRLGARIHNLKEKGHSINSERITFAGKHFARYSIA